MTYQNKVVTFLEGYVDKPAENTEFLNKIKSWIMPKQKKEKNTIFCLIKTIYSQQRSKVADKFYLGSEFLTIVEFSFAKIAGKYMLVNIFIQNAFYNVKCKYQNYSQIKLITKKIICCVKTFFLNFDNKK